MKSPFNKMAPLFRTFVAGLVVLISSMAAQANPFASGITNNNGTIQFYLNEGNAFITVVYEDGSTNTTFNGVSATATAGLKTFALGGHTSFQIICTKLGNGTPFLISSDTGAFGPFGAPRGVDANKNPKIGSQFGRVYVGNAGVSTTRDWGLYALTADLSANALGVTNIGSFAPAQLTNAWRPARLAGSTSGPYRMTVAPDNTVYVTDFSTAGGGLWQFDADLNINPASAISNLVLYPLGENQGIAAGTHGDPIGVYTTGSIATGDLKVYTFDPGLGAPTTAQFGAGGMGGTPSGPGDFNELYRYDIGAGPLPWTNAPNLAINLGLPGFFDSQIGDVTLGNDGKLIGLFRRANFSDGCIQVFDPNSGERIYNSLRGAVGSQSDVFINAYGGVRVSPDGRFLATININNAILIANMTNGTPDDSSLVTIANTPTTGNARGIAWDAAGNIYASSSGQGLLRYYSLGNSSTTISSNDFTGTNGSFQLVLPATTASVAASTPQGSQNYGSPTPAVFSINLDQSTLATPVTVNFTRSGTATYSNNLPTGNYTINIGTNDDGVIISSNSVTFPAGTWTHGGNWSAAVQIIPTVNPVSGPTLTVGMKLSGGATYLAGAPVSATTTIQNTGPQVLLLSAATSGTTMSRAIAHDSARFVITRLGDTNGPGNTAGNVVPKSYTATNATYSGTAVFPTDYTARAQRVDPAGDGIVQLPVDGSPGIVIRPGDVTINAEIGNPVSHAGSTLPPSNVTVTIGLTNAATGTNLTSLEGFSYAGNVAAVTVTELDNATGPEVVLWSNPLTDALDSTNWTLTFAATNFASTNVLPVVIPNYTNDFSSIPGGGTNDFSVSFGAPISADSIAPSPVMQQKGWNTALRMTVNKNNFSPAGVNVYPQGLKFAGNYALRFSMYLSMYSTAINNPLVGTYPREFAAFGINHTGTNCDWRLAAPLAAGTGNSPINADGIWFAIDAASGSQTPADFDAFTSPALPNNGVTADLVSNTSQSQNGVFKHPPFASETSTGPGAGGQPINQWVDVSVEVTGQTNVVLRMDGAPVLSNFAITNGGNYTNGTIMLGYLDPVRDVSDNTAFAYFSNVRVVELSPTIQAQPVSLIVTQGANVTLSSSATLATAPLTSTWYRGLTTPLLALQTNSANATNLTDSLTVNNIQTGTNFMTIFSDVAGSVTSLVATVEVVPPPANQSAAAGSLVKFTVVPTGNSAPTSFQWKTNGVSLANNSHYGGVTTSSLFITNAQPADAGTYSVTVFNPAGNVTVSATLTITVGPSGFTVTPVAQTNFWGSTITLNTSGAGTPPFTYRWKKGGVNLADGGTVAGSGTSSLTLTGITTADAGSYTVGVTNAVGGTVSSAGTLVVLVPAPSFGPVTNASGSILLSFTSPNVYDTTNAFILQSSALVTGPYTNTPASFTTSGGTFQVSLPPSGGNMFYRLLHAN